MIASRKPNRDITFKTIEELADWFGQPVRTLEKWPQRYQDSRLGKPGAWSAQGFARCAFEVSRNRHVFAEADGDSVKDLLALAELRLTEAKAIEKERDNEVAEGKLIPRDVVERWAAEVFTIFREAKVAIPDAVANLLPPDSREMCRAELDRLEREVLRQARIKIDELAHADPGSNETH